MGGDEYVFVLGKEVVEEIGDGMCFFGIGRILDEDVVFVFELVGDFELFVVGGFVE